jgi:hypothetical protein
MDPKELPLPADEAKKLAEQAEQPERQEEARQAEEETKVNPADSNLERIFRQFCCAGFWRRAGRMACIGGLKSAFIRKLKNNFVRLSQTTTYSVKGINDYQLMVRINCCEICFNACLTSTSCF